MKFAIILLWAVALAAGHDDWRRPPHNTPSGAQTPEPATWVMAAVGLGVVAWKHGRYRKAK